MLLIIFALYIEEKINISTFYTFFVIHVTSCIYQTHIDIEDLIKVEEYLKWSLKSRNKEKKTILLINRYMFT